MKKALFRRWWFRITTLIVVLCVGLLIYAPYLTRFVTEGYPAPEWPAYGEFAQVEGTQNSPSFLSGPKKPVTKDLQALLEQKEGKALIAYRPGQPVVTFFANGINQHTKFNSYSLVKSLVGALVLKAVAEKKIESLEDPINKYLPDLGNAEFKKTTIRHFLDMRSGLIFQKRTSAEGVETSYKNIQAQLVRINPFSPMVRLHAEGLQSVNHHLTIQAQNRGQYNYQNVNTAVLGAVLEKVYNKPLNTLLSEKLWKPAGAATAQWRLYYKGGTISPYCCLYASAEDWVKVGFFLIKNGTPERPFLPENLWQRYLGAGISEAESRQNAYQNHVRYNILDRREELLRGKFAYFTGQYGQVVYLVPEQNLVVVRFGGQMQKLHSTLYMVGRSMNE